jgi:hypothetical protein
MLSHAIPRTNSDIVEDYYFPQETSVQVEESGMIPIMFQPSKADVISDHAPKKAEKDALDLGLEVKGIIDKRVTQSGIEYKILWKSSWVSGDTLARLEKKKQA